MNKYVILLIIGFIFSSEFSMITAKTPFKGDPIEDLILFVPDNSASSISEDYGFMNLSGEIIVPPLYVHDLSCEDYDRILLGLTPENVPSFSCGMSRVYDPNRGYGFIDTRGVEVIPCQYEMALPFFEDLAAVRTDTGWGYINKKGEFIVVPKYYLATGFNEGRAFVAKSNNDSVSYSIIDSNGKLITNFIYADISRNYPYFSEGLAWCRKDDKWICVDRNGKIKFDKKVEYGETFVNGLSIFEEYSKYGIINKFGSVQLKPQYDRIYLSDIDSVYIVEKNGKLGAMNASFEPIIPPIYNWLNIGENGYFTAQKDEKYGFLNPVGKMIIPFKYDNADTFKENVGLACVELNGKYGYVNTIGEETIPLMYDQVYRFEDSGYAMVKRGDLYALIDAEQVPLIPYQEKAKVEAKGIGLSRLNAKSDVDINIPKNVMQNYRTIVLVIANEKYYSNKVSNVLFARNDGKSFSDYCKLTFGVSENNIMIIEDATLTQIKSGIKWLQQKASIGDVDKVIVYYAGHGIPDYSTSQSYLLPSDGNPLDLMSAYPLAEFYNQLSLINAKQCVAIIDACFSGMDRRGDAINEVRGISIKPSEELPKGNVVVLSACSGDEIAQPFPSKHHGVFTYYLLKYLQDNNGKGTIKELSNFIKRNVINTTLSITGKVQTPTLFLPQNKPISWESWEFK